MQCTICLEDTKKDLSCPYCKSVTCLKCAKTCALTWASEPKCASCNKAFTLDQVEAMFTKSFRRGDLRIQATKNLLEQEMSLLPETLERINMEKAQTEYYKVYSKMSTATHEFLQEPTRDSAEYFKTIIELQADLLATGYSHAAAAKKAVKRRSVKCPKDDCAGFIFSSGPGCGTCGVCSTKVCLECNALKVDNHVCNPDDVASYTIIKQSCVQCPKCAAQIQKISGCNQMWCTATDCNTAFDWVSGRVINGPVHNPHYHQWLAQNNQQPVQQVNCDDPRAAFTAHRIGFVYECYETLNAHLPKSKYALVKQFMRSAPESFDIFRRPAAYGPMSYDSHRRKYLRGQITKSQWTSNLSHNETLRRKNEKLWQTYLMFQTASSDIFNLFYKQTYEESLKPETASRNVRNRYGAIRLIKVIDPVAAEPFFKAFYDSMEALRIYHIREICKILDDYADTSALVLEWRVEDIGRSLIWSRHAKSQLVNDYLK